MRLSKRTINRYKNKTKRQELRVQKECYAESLRNNLPKSELWFKQNWAPLQGEERNIVMLGFIPDITNRLGKYIIEIDGAIHNTEEVKSKDAIKDAAFERNGYKVYRIPAYNLDELNVVRKLVEARLIAFVNSNGIVLRRKGNV